MELFFDIVVKRLPGAKVSISFIFSLERPVRGDDLIKARPMVRTVEERVEFL